MSMIDELQRLLDEAGLELRSYWDDGFVYRADEYVHFAWTDGERVYKVYRFNTDDGTLCIDGLTPEQAIAATLGTSQAADEWGDGFRAGCDAANGASRESVEHYKAENDKLRELLSVMAYCNQFRRDCDGCSLNGAAGIITERAGCDELLASLRELGVEVD